MIKKMILVSIYTGIDKQNFSAKKNISILLPIICHICFGCSKERFF